MTVAWETPNRAARRKIPEGLRRRLRVAVFTRDRWTCQRCGLRMLPKTDNERSGRNAPFIDGVGWLELDHITPMDAGGMFREENLRAACSPCNRSKGASLEFAGWQERIDRAMGILAGHEACERAARRAVAALLGEDEGDHF